MTDSKTPELTELERALKEAQAALLLHEAWAHSEDAGPDYGDFDRTTHPDGERIWRQWWEGNLSLCDRANRATKKALPVIAAALNRTKDNTHAE